MKKKRAQDPFADLKKLSALTLIGEYRPVVGYLYSNGDVVKFSQDNAAWYSFDRAVSACFGSAAKRLRGTWDAALHKRGYIVAFLMIVLDSRNQIAWKQRVDLPAETTR